MKLVCGLGNPGARYVLTRHNVGFLVLDALADGRSAPWSERWEARIARTTLHGVDLVLVQPLTFMNLSGLAVSQVMRFFHIPPADVLVVHDDVDLALGRLLVKQGGGDAGHKGIRSILGEIGPDFARIRVGIGRPATPDDGDVVDWVLRPFGDEEWKVVEATVGKAVDAIGDWVLGGVSKAQNRANRRQRPPRPETTPCPETDARGSGPTDRKEVE